MAAREKERLELVEIANKERKTRNLQLRREADARQQAAMENWHQLLQKRKDDYEQRQGVRKLSLPFTQVNYYEYTITYMVHTHLLICGMSMSIITRV